MKKFIFPIIIIIILVLLFMFLQPQEEKDTIPGTESIPKPNYNSCSSSCTDNACIQNCAQKQIDYAIQLRDPEQCNPLPEEQIRPASPGRAGGHKPPRIPGGRRPEGARP